MFKAIKSQILLNFNSSVKSIYRMIFTGDLDRYKGFHIKLLDDSDLKLVSTDEFESSLEGIGPIVPIK